MSYATRFGEKYVVWRLKYLSPVISFNELHSNLWFFKLQAAFWQSGEQYSATLHPEQDEIFLPVLLLEMPQLWQTR